MTRHLEDLERCRAEGIRYFRTIPSIERVLSDPQLQDVRLADEFFVMGEIAIGARASTIAPDLFPSPTARLIESGIINRNNVYGVRKTEQGTSDEVHQLILMFDANRIQMSLDIYKTEQGRGEGNPSATSQRSPLDYS